MSIMIHVDGERYLLTHQNCAVYRFRTNPFIDHAHYVDEGIAFYIFGRDDLLEKMEEQGHTIIIQQIPPDSDVDAYLNWQDQNTDWSAP